MTRRSGPLSWELDLASIRAPLIGGLVFSVLRAVLQWLAPVPLKVVFDSVLGSHPLAWELRWLPSGRFALLYSLCVLMVAIAALLGVCSYAAAALLAGAGQRVIVDLRCRLFAHLVRQSRRFYTNRPVGDLLARLGGDAQAMQSAVVNVAPVVAENALTVLGMLVIMMVVDWQFGILALCVFPILLALVRHYLSTIKQAQRTARRAEGASSSTAQHVLVGVAVVQASGAESEEVERYRASALEALQASRLAVVLQSRFTPLVTFVMTTSTAAVVLLGGREVVAGRLTPGDLLLFSAYFRSMYTPVRQLAKLAGTMGRGQASAERVLEVLHTHDEPSVSDHPRRPSKVRGELAFDAVSFSYPGRPSFLERIELSVDAGSRHAIVGATGSGKSTLLRLALRFADPEAGCVRFDGVDIRSLDLEWLRRQISFVPQETVLLRPTVWENISYGSDLTTRGEAIAAARAAGVHELLASLPDGYDTPVGEAGSALSGGQRQCIAVARAMARGGRLILLDEPTTGMDASTQSVVVEAFARLSEGRTTLMVTHHLLAVRNVDAITVMDTGRIIEHGTHSDLIESGAAYNTLHLASTGASGD